MTIITLRGPEPVATIVGFRDDAKLDPIWISERRIRIREGNGWREIQADEYAKSKPVVPKGVVK